MIPNDIRRLTRLGWHVFPVSRHSKSSCFKGAKEEATTDERIISGWVGEFRDCNWRAHPGKSKILCLDIDRAGDLHDCDGFETMEKLVGKHGRLPDGPRLKTGGSGGCVAFFRWEGQELRGGPSALGPGIDVSTIRGAACPTLPPSFHQRTGNPYVWHHARAPWQIALPPIPSWICEALKPLPIPEVDLSQVSAETGSRKLQYYAQDIINAPSGLSNRTIYGKSFKAGLLVGAGILQYQEAEQTLYHAALQRVKPEKRHSIMPSIRSGLRKGMVVK